MTDLNIRITVELHPSPQLVQLLERLQPGKLPGKLAGPEQPPTALETFMTERRSLRKQSMPSMGETEELLHPGPKGSDKQPQEAGEELKHQDSDIYLLEEIKPFKFDKQNFVGLSNINPALEYYEQEDLLCIRYISTNVWTTWSSIKKLHARFGIVSKNKKWGPLLKQKDKGNRRQMVSYFLHAINGGLKPGQAAGSQEDPDADFRPHLDRGHRYIDQVRW